MTASTVTKSGVKMHLFFLSDILKELNRLTWLQWGWDHNIIRSRTYSDFSKFHLVPLLKYQMITCQKKKSVVACYEHLSSVVLLTNEQLTRPLVKFPDETCKLRLELD